MNTEAHIIEGNELIADFMGLSDNLPVLYDLNPANLSYNHSWDSIMRVMDKIESLKFNGRSPWTDIKTFLTNDRYYECIIKIRTESGEGYIYENTEWCDKKIEAVYQAVLDFIKWYNKQKT